MTVVPADTRVDLLHLREDEAQTVVFRHDAERRSGIATGMRLKECTMTLQITGSVSRPEKYLSPAC